MNAKPLAITLVAALGVAAWAGCGSGAGSPDTLTIGGGGGPGGGGPGGGGPGGGGPGGPGGGPGGSDGGASKDGGGGGVVDAAPAKTVQQALAEVAACMTLTKFQSSGLVDFPNAQTVQDGPCVGCHAQGEAGFWASYGTVNGTDMSQMMFDKTKLEPYLGKYIAPILQNGQFADLQPSGAIDQKANAAAACTPSAQNNNWCHPKFQLAPFQEQAIKTFVDDTLTMWHSNTCPAPTPPTDGGLDGGGPG